MNQLPGSVFLKMDFTEDKTSQKIMELLKGGKADVILSDMAPSYTGHSQIDHTRLMDLAEKALEFCNKGLREGGCCIIKISSGGTGVSFLSFIYRAKQQTGLHFILRDTKSLVLC